MTIKMVSLRSHVRKAFNRVDHGVLLLKLSLLKLSISGTFHRWLGSLVYATSGVPQGSITSIFLFLLLLNDFPCAISDCNILMYADNVQLFYTFDDDQVRLFFSVILICL